MTTARFDPERGSEGGPEQERRVQTVPVKASTRRGKPAHDVTVAE
jgi:hypothetical protein